MHQHQPLLLLLPLTAAQTLIPFSFPALPQVPTSQSACQQVYDECMQAFRDCLTAVGSNESGQLGCEAYQSDVCEGKIQEGCDMLPNGGEVVSESLVDMTFLTVLTRSATLNITFTATVTSNFTSPQFIATLTTLAQPISQPTTRPTAQLTSRPTSTPTYPTSSSTHTPTTPTITSTAPIPPTLATTITTVTATTGATSQTSTTRGLVFTSVSSRTRCGVGVWAWVVVGMMVAL